MEWTPVKSSHIEAVAHEGTTLSLRYTSGTVVHLDGVTADDYAALHLAESVGKHVHQLRRRDGVTERRA